MISSKEMWSIRDFLRAREALLVHFSTCMSRHEHEYLFPEDLRNAGSLVGRPLSFSTILSSDNGPFATDGQPQNGNAAGSIGIVVDINHDSVLTVAPSDSGTSYDKLTGEWISGGKQPSGLTCAESIDLRDGVNEWLVKNYIVIGIFFFEPCFARYKTKMQEVEEEIICDVEVNVKDILLYFPENRIFTTKNGVFFEFIRKSSNWVKVSYDKIIERA